MALLVSKANSKENNFTFLRFFAAFAVIIGHNFILFGLKEPEISRFDTIGGIAVSIFFIISGFLITKSWLDNPKISNFFWKRVLRLFPALIVVTLFAVLIIGPMVTTLSHEKYFYNALTWGYLKNMLLFPIQYHLPGVFENNPSNAVNGSIWTLPIEFFMYFSLAIAGLLGLLPKKIFIPSILLILMYLDQFVVPGSEYQNLVMLSFMPIQYGVKYGIYFFIGSLLYLYREKIHLILSIAVISMILYIFSIRMLHLGVLSYFTLPYIVIYFAFGIEHNFFKNIGKYGDFSYGLYIYAFPVQQTLVYYFENRISFLTFSIGVFIITLFSFEDSHLKLTHFSHRKLTHLIY